MALRRVSRLRDCGVFRDFSWPTELPNFGQYNLIYGWNGSGKTTLSRLLRALELRRVRPLGRATVRIDNHDVPPTLSSARKASTIRRKPTGSDTNALMLTPHGLWSIVYSDNGNNNTTSMLRIRLCL